MKVNHARLTEVLTYDPLSGAFAWRDFMNGRATAGGAAGTTTVTGHRQIRLDGRQYKAHRLAWLYVHGVWPRGCIDHINGNPSDNRIANLRDATPFVNAQNLHGPTIRNTTGFLGVTKHRGRWCSSIQSRGKRHFLGAHDTAEQAYFAYLEAKRRLHEGCTL